MRELFDEGTGPSPLDPDEQLRRSARATLTKRFYKTVSVSEQPEGIAVLLDSRPVKTPARRALALPAIAIAEAIAAEWRAQGETIDPGSMPLTRLCNSIIDGVIARSQEVAADIAKYFGSDLL